MRVARAAYGPRNSGLLATIVRNSALAHAKERVTCTPKISNQGKPTPRPTPPGKPTAPGTPPRQRAGGRDVRIRQTAVPRALLRMILTLMQLSMTQHNLTTDSMIFVPAEPLSITPNPYDAFWNPTSTLSPDHLLATGPEKHCHTHHAGSAHKHKPPGPSDRAPGMNSTPPATPKKANSFVDSKGHTQLSNKGQFSPVRVLRGGQALRGARDVLWMGAISTEIDFTDPKEQRRLVETLKRRSEDASGRRAARSSAMT